MNFRLNKINCIKNSVAKHLIFRFLNGLVTDKMLPDIVKAYKSNIK